MSAYGLSSYVLNFFLSFFVFFIFFIASNKRSVVVLIQCASQFSCISWIKSLNAVDFVPFVSSWKDSDALNSIKNFSKSCINSWINSLSTFVFLLFVIVYFLFFLFFNNIIQNPSEKSMQSLLKASRWISW